MQTGWDVAVEALEEETCGASLDVLGGGLVGGGLQEGC